MSDRYIKRVTSSSKNPTRVKIWGGPKGKKEGSPLYQRIRKKKERKF